MPSAKRFSLIAVGLALAALLAVAPLANAKKAKRPLPDLVIVKVSKPPAQTTAGARLKIVVKVRNKGKAGVGKSRVGIYLQEKRAGAKGKKPKVKRRRLKRAKVKPLRPGKKGKAKLRIRLPAGLAPGTYRLAICADDTRRVRESKERNNCRISKGLKVTVEPAARPAFALTDNFDSAFGDDTSGKEIVAGDPLTATLRVGNGIPGGAGYSRSDVSGEPLLSGPTTTFNFGSEEDDGSVAATLPFDFPFGGISERALQVSTNGWIQFGGGPAFDYWADIAPYDYRGIDKYVGEFERGIMPYWADLDIGEPSDGSGTVKMVTAGDGSAVAFQWDTGQHSGGGDPRRVMQLVLFPDGRFRLDYPGENTTGGNEAFIGFTLGTGAGSITTVGANTEAVPPSSVLFTPNPEPAAGALAAGQATMSLPEGSAYVSGDPSCAVTTAPDPLSEGLVTCDVPELAPGQQASREVVFAVPPNAPDESNPANFRYKGTFLSGGFSLNDEDEVDLLSSSLEDATLKTKVGYASLIPKVGVPVEFVTQVNSNAGALDEPRATFNLPANTTLDSIEISGQAIPCTPISGGQTTCKLPSGANSVEILVIVTPNAGAIGSGLTLSVTGDALNAPPDTGSDTSPAVVAGP